MAPGFSLKEAAAIVGVPEPAVRKAIETRTIRPRVVSSGRAPRYRFGIKDMLYLKLVADFPLALTKEDRAALRHLIERTRQSAGRWQARGGEFVVRAGGVAVHVEVRALRTALARDLIAYRRGRRRIVSDPAIVGGEPVFEGTRIPLAHIAALLARKVPLDEIAEDYPALSHDDLAFAAIQAKMKRNPGRPRKPLGFTRTAEPVRAAAGVRDDREAVHR